MDPPFLVEIEVIHQSWRGLSGIILQQRLLLRISCEYVLMNKEKKYNLAGNQKIKTYEFLKTILDLR